MEPHESWTEVETGNDGGGGEGRRHEIFAFSPRPLPHRFVSTSVQLSRRCISYFTKHKKPPATQVK